ncbi:MAG: hydantoinase/carbamoylase family amidase, partial [Rhodospirillaceae bacterium]|nr:hydantoinase/carbamoylase family amidase [Rhodospirillaceae bacterium]
MAEAVRIDGGRLLADLHELRNFGRCDPGVVRRSFSDADRESRDWLRGRFAEAGLDARIDGVGNVIGRSANPGPALLIGSHSDTQPRGGWLDGAMGVIYALEVARALAENDATRNLAVDAVAWMDEEGTFLNCLGCHSFMGSLPDGLLARATSYDGLTAAEEIKAAGYDKAAPARWEPERHVGYLEAHIEQGPYLEEQGNRVGVVTSIVGRRNVTLTFEGEQNHAGTTPMDRRKDAGMAAIRLGAAIDAAFKTIAGPATVWTIGDLTIEPGKTTSIVPGRAVMHFQFRDPEA